MTRNRDGLIAALEGLSCVEQLSSRFKISSRVLVYAGLVLLLLILLAVCLTGFGEGGEATAVSLETPATSMLEQPPTSFDSASAAPISDVPTTARTQTLVVYVTGAVESPGLYTLAGASRVGDAVAAAGGLTPEAATAVVNLAQPVQDGMQIHIPRIAEVAENAPASGVLVPDTSTSGGTSAPGSAPASTLVNINTADSASLQTLSGVGPATAQKIIEYRAAHGPFERKEDLMQVSGIGEKKYAAIEAQITI